MLNTVIGAQEIIWRHTDFGIILILGIPVNGLGLNLLPMHASIHGSHAIQGDILI